MDAIHAWDQQDIHFHVPHWIDHSVDQVILYQTSLRGVAGRSGRAWGIIAPAVRAAWAQRE
jgi:hypothetical protein